MAKYNGPTINATGIAEIKAFLDTNHKLGGEYFTPAMLQAWACAALAAGLKPWVPRRTPVGLGLRAPPK